MDLTSMSRKEKFKYLKANGVKCVATMKTEELDALMKKLDDFQRGDADEPPTGVDSKTARQARRRVPLGQHRMKLSTDHLNIPEGKVARWVNDKPGRIAAALEGGYELVRNPDKETAGEDPLVTSSMGDSVSAVVGTKEGGDALTAYLMVIDEDLYKEDQAFKQKQLDQLDEAIKTGQVQPGEGQYIPNQGSGIKYEQGSKS